MSKSQANDTKEGNKSMIHGYIRGASQLFNSSFFKYIPNDVTSKIDNNMYSEGNAIIENNKMLTMSAQQNDEKLPIENVPSQMNKTEEEFKEEESNKSTPDSKKHINTAVKTKFNPSKCEFQEWLSNEVKLIQYHKILVENGYDNMDAIETLNLDILREIGVNKIGHRHQIMRNVDKLKYGITDISQDIHNLHREMTQIAKDISNIAKCLEKQNTHKSIWATMSHYLWLFEGV